MTAGTPSYMAPEQAMGVTPLDRRVDIYSLTAVTYAMLTGHPPFLVRSIADIVARDTSQPPHRGAAWRTGHPRRCHGVRTGCRSESTSTNGPAARGGAGDDRRPDKPAGAFEQVLKTIMTARPSPRVESPLAPESLRLTRRQ
jgi:serine/threonine protein kinase